MNKSVVAVFLSAFFVAACGDNSASVGAGSGADVSTKSGETVGKSKTISAEKDASFAIKVPAQIAITDALFRGGLTGMGRRARSNGFAGEVKIPGVDFSESMAETTKNEYDKDPKKWEEEGKNLDPNLVELVKSGASLDQITDYYRRGTYLRHFAACVGPAPGWEVDPLPEGKKPLQYMRYIATACDFTSQVYSLIASRLGPKVAENPEDAKRKIAKTYYTTPLPMLEGAWDSAVEANKSGEFSANLTNVEGVQFTGPDAYYSSANGGFTVNRGGMIWFGAGMISGKNVELALSSSVSQKVDKTKGMDHSQETGVGSKTGAEIGVK